MADEAIPQPPWLPPPRGGARKQLTREAIVDAAMNVLDAEGLDGLSMRRVAAELGAGAASLYWHVRNREELVHQLIDRVAGELVLPEPDPSRWQDQLKELGREMRRRFLAHRDIARATLGRIPLGPNTLRVAEWVHGLLREAGLPDRTVALAVDLLSLYIGAIAVEESGEITAVAGEAFDPGAEVEMFRSYFKSLPVESFPHTVALADLLVEGDADERFEFGLEVIVSGLERTARR